MVNQINSVGRQALAWRGEFSYVGAWLGEAGLVGTGTVWAFRSVALSLVQVWQARLEKLRSGLSRRVNVWHGEARCGELWQAR